jgi:hypothetical protein
MANVVESAAPEKFQESAVAPSGNTIAKDTNVAKAIRLIAVFGFSRSARDIISSLDIAITDRFHRPFKWLRALSPLD